MSELEFIKGAYAGEASSEERYTVMAANFDAAVNQARADAWHEGFCVGEQMADREPPANPYAINPYRKDRVNE